MCGIFGSNNFEKYKTLYQLNKDRGSFAYGSLYTYSESRPLVQRAAVSEIPPSNVDVSECTFYFGHTQGPTSAQREFDTKTSHPFAHLNWRVAHNGVLSNSKALAEKYKVDNPVDSAVIPVIIWNKFAELYDPDVWVWVREQRAIKLACEELQGTFSCWIHNRDTNNVYLVRCGSTLFAGENEFSSAQAEGMTPLDDGCVYRLYHEDDRQIWLENHEAINTKSPFFIL